MKFYPHESGFGALPFVAAHGVTVFVPLFVNVATFANA